MDNNAGATDAFECFTDVDHPLPELALLLPSLAIGRRCWPFRYRSGWLVILSLGDGSGWFENQNESRF